MKAEPYRIKPIPYVFGESRAQHRERVCDHVRMDIEIDRPFEEMRRDAALKKQAAFVPTPPTRASAAGGEALGFTSNATKGAVLEKIEIDRDESRVKRMRTSVTHAARLIDFEAGNGGFRYNKKFLTLTYAGVDDWEAQHINDFRRRMRDWFRRRNMKFRAVWVAELQQRGAIHYHMIVWVPVGKLLPKPDKSGWWPHGRSNIKTAQNPVGYIAKYASKTTAVEAARYPKGARMHGAIGLDPEMRRHVRYWQAPWWVRDALTGRADIRKVRGGYADRNKLLETGEMLPSPWRVSIEAGGRVFAYRIPTAKVH